MSKAMESHYLAEMHGLRGQPEDRAKSGERLTPNRTADKTKESPLATPKPLQPGLHPSLGSAHHGVPGLVPSHGMYLGPPGAHGPGVLTAAMMLQQRTNEEERWLARQRKLRQEKEDRQYQVSEFRQQVLDQHLDLGRGGEGADMRIEGHRSLSNHHESSGRDSRDLHHHLGAPPPLISPKPQPREHGPPHHPPPPTTLWNPAALIESPSSDSRRSSASAHSHEPPELSRPHFDISRLASSGHLPPGSSNGASSKAERLEDSGGGHHRGGRKDGLDRYPHMRGPLTAAAGGGAVCFPEPGAYLAELEKSTQSFLSQQRAAVSLTSQYGDLSASLKAAAAIAASGGPYKGLLQGPPPPRLGPEPALVYDEFLQQHRRPVSKLDLEEKRRREAREKGYYYELDDSYDESDEEEVRAHMRRVAQQPPLKLDESTEKVDFLRVFGLTTLSRRDELLQQKRRKRRRMLRERSPSPPAVQSKRVAGGSSSHAGSPTAPSAATTQLSTRFTPEEMDSTPQLEDKIRFLTMFSLSHVSQEQRRDNERVVELLQAIKQKSVTLDTLRHNSHPLCKSPSAYHSDSTSSQPPAESEDAHGARPPSPSLAPGGHALPCDPSTALDQQHKHSADPLRPKDPSLSAALPDKARGSEGPSAKKSSSLLNSMRPPPHPKDGPPASLNGRVKPWESFTAEEFAQQFHESVLQSTQKALQKHKGGASVISEPNHALDSSVHYNIPELQSAPGRSASSSSHHHPGHPHVHGHGHPHMHPHAHSHPQPNGPHCPLPPRPELAGPRNELSADEDSNDEEYEDEDEAPTPRWQGIEAIFEAYQEYIEEQGIERQVLQSQCRRLEAHHYNLSLTAEQLSHTMGDLMAQKQKLAAEREKLQAELEHFRKCLSLPQTHWSRAHFKGYPPR
ncbi:hypothetical protein AALO_G00188860 [Alosa alosa]|uniref:Genetic suppressor element-like domain-containing protein n=1 Tax=Alosa alosa TaxID=278164 RepID=A0AAV6G9M5_9TELE|nr:hypothetical protein AALO_G00188860 [Alosa alosa]